MDTVIFLSGTTRGATLEGIGRSFASGFRALGVEFVEISLLDQAGFLEAMRVIDFQRVRLVFSWVSMGMEIALCRDDGTGFNPWQEMSVPFLSLHGDSPAYFFDRHVVRDSRFVSLYGFAEHAELRRRLPLVRGPVSTYWPPVLDELALDELDMRAKKRGTLLFLKNGKDPAWHRTFWASVLGPPLLQAMLELAGELDRSLDDPATNQIDDLVTAYFKDRGFDPDPLPKLRLFLIAQLDDYLRAVKCTRMAEALMDFPVEVRGNNWGHLDFTGKMAVCIDDCDYTRSTGLIRRSLGMIDMSPNTGSRPHDRVMRAYGAHTLCLTNEQEFLDVLPHRGRLSFRFEKGNLQEKVADLLAHPDDAVEIGIEVAREYRRRHPPEQLPQTMLDWSSFVRFNHLSQRPPGMQDFVVWPPAGL